MSFLDFFRSWTTPEKKEPAINGFSLGGILLSYDFSLSSYYLFYDSSPYVGMVIDRIKRDVSAYGYEIRKNDQPNTKAVEDFRTLVKASLNMSPREFIERIIRDYAVTGNAYVYVAREGNKVVGLQVLDPRYMKPIVRKNGEVLWYVQELDGYAYFTRDEVYHLKTDSDTANEAIGRSKMRPLFTDLKSDNEAKESNLAFFLNNQTPSSIVVTDPAFKLPTDPAKLLAFRKEIKDMFSSGKYQWWKNRHRSAIIEWVKDVVKLQDKINDAEFLMLRRFTLELVCGMYGVNKNILGFTENSNYAVGDDQSANYFAMIEAKENILDEFLSNIFASVFGPEYKFVSLKDNIRTLIIKSRMARELYKDELLTKNEARDIVNYEPVSDGDSFYTKGNTVLSPSEEKDAKKEKSTWRK